MDEEDSSQIEAYAKYIGLDPILDSNFIWLAKQGLYSELPKGWESSVDPNSNEIYYFKHRSGGRKPIVTWEHPKDEYYKELAKQIRRQREAEEYKNRLNNRKKLSPTNKKLSQNLIKELKKARTLRMNMISNKPRRRQQLHDDNLAIMEKQNITSSGDDDIDVDTVIPSTLHIKNTKSKYKVNRITSPILIQEDDANLTTDFLATITTPPRRGRSIGHTINEKISPILKNNNKQKKKQLKKKKHTSSTSKDIDITGTLHLEQLDDLTIEQLQSVENSLKDLIQEKNDEIISNFEGKILLEDELQLLKQRATETTQSLMKIVNS